MGAHIANDVRFINHKSFRLGDECGMESQEFLNYAENVDPVDLEENVVGARGGGVARTRSPISRGHKHAQIPACQKLHNQTQKRIQRSKLTLLNNLSFCW